MADETYDNIRHPEILGPCIGATLLDVTQEDREEWAQGKSYLSFHFSNGYTITFPIDPADDVNFTIEEPDSSAARMSRTIEDVLTDEERERIDTSHDENRKDDDRL